MTEVAEKTPAASTGGTPGTWTEVLAIFLRLGLTSFGGPVAHLGYFREEFVAKRRWLDDRTYADIVALCQFLPGPASSQVGIAIGLSRAGYAGAFAAWMGFTMPSAIALVAFAYGVDALGGAGGAGWLHGLKVAAVAVVAQAVLGMMRQLTPDRERATIAVATAAVILALPSAWTLVGMILAGGIVGTLLLRAEAPTDHVSLPLPVSRRTGGVLLAIFFVLLAGLPLLAAATSSHGVELIDAFYRAGSLVFGGGHVILPLLQESVVPPGWVSNDLARRAGDLRDLRPRRAKQMQRPGGAALQSASCWPSGWGPPFELMSEAVEHHHAPWGADQSFAWTVLERR